jgi:hypothetical protein
VRVFGEIRADLEQRGTPIGAYDLLIAAQAKSRDLVLVTNNMREEIWGWCVTAIVIFWWRTKVYCRRNTPYLS